MIQIKKIYKLRLSPVKATQLIFIIFHILKTFADIFLNLEHEECSSLDRCHSSLRSTMQVGFSSELRSEMKRTIFTFMRRELR